MFKEERDDLNFCWADLGNIQAGRPNMGDNTSVLVYRLMQYTLRDVLIKRLDPTTAGEVYYEAGKKAGEEFCKNMLDEKLGFDEFVAQVQKALKEYGIGIFRLEKVDPDKSEIVLTVDEDLDCSGLPVSDETVCDYDEGFIAGILESYTGHPFHVKEVDCWAMGGRTCRFRATRKA